MSERGKQTLLPMGSRKFFPSLSIQTRSPMDKYQFFSSLSIQARSPMDKCRFFARVSTQRGVLVNGCIFIVYLSTERPFLMDKFSLQVCSHTVLVSPERKGFPRRGEEGPPPSPPQPRREETRSQPFFRAPSFRTGHQELLEVILGSAGK